MVVADGDSWNTDHWLTPVLSAAHWGGWSLGSVRFVPVLLFNLMLHTLKIPTHGFASGGMNEGFYG